MTVKREKFNTEMVLDLRDKLTAFNVSGPQEADLKHLLQCYLKFYGLPRPSDEISFQAGTAEEEKIALIAWSPVKSLGTAIIVHGYMDHIGLYGHLVKELLNRHITVLCFDAKGHGLSKGVCGSINNFSEYIDTLEIIIRLAQQHFHGPFHGIGQSMGGAVLMKHLLTKNMNTPYPFTTLNLLTPLLRPWGWEQSQRLYNLSYWFVKSIKRIFRPSSWDNEFLTFLKNTDPMQPKRLPMDWIGAMDAWIKEFEQLPPNDFPCHIIQGNHDKTLDWQHNLKQFKHKFPSSSVSIINNGNHHLVNETELLRKEIFGALRL